MVWAAALGRMTARVRDTFPASVVYRPAAGGTYPMTAVFDEAAEKTELGQGGAPVETTRPVLTVRLADLAALGVVPRTRDRLEVAGRTWEVKGGTRDDGSGMAALELVEVS